MEGRKEDQENFLEADENGRKEVRPWEYVLQAVKDGRLEGRPREFSWSWQERKAGRRTRIICPSSRRRQKAGRKRKRICPWRRGGRKAGRKIRRMYVLEAEKVWWWVVQDPRFYREREMELKTFRNVLFIW
jgi:hypothetical protein